MKNTMLYNDCLNQYKNALQKSINEVERYYYPSRLTEIHEEAKGNSLSQVYNQKIYFDINAIMCISFEIV